MWYAIPVLLFLFSPVAIAESATGESVPAVARAQFTTAIKDREPVDAVAILRPPADEIYFFTDLRQMQGRTATHQWRYKGELVSVVPFDIGGPRWRVFSKKVLGPGEFGEWSVTVVDDNGWPLYMELFRYEPAE